MLRKAESFAGIEVSTLVAGAVGDDPGGWLESRLGPVMEHLETIEPERPYSGRGGTAAGVS